jgi:hypothetical protein
MAEAMIEVATDPDPQWAGYARGHHRQIVWLYGGTMPLAAQIPCIANLQGFTLRKGFVAARGLLMQRDRGDLYESLLESMGVHDMTRAEVTAALAKLTAAYDYALAVIRTPFWGFRDIQPVSRPMVIDGAREVLDTGHHREIMFWITNMRAWVQNAIDNDGSETEAAAFRAEYEALLARLDASTAGDLERKAARLRQLLDEIMSLAEEIIAGHPDIVHGA